MTRTTLVLLLAAGLLGGCTAPDAGTTTPSPTPPASDSSSVPASPAASGSGSPGATAFPSGALTLMLVRSGGIAGVYQSITIAADGSWTYVDKRSGATSTGRLSPDQLAQLTRMVQDPRLAQDLRQPSDVVCSDAFQYALIIGALSATFEDCGHARPAVDAVLAFVADATDF